MAIDVSNTVNFRGNTVKTKKGGEYKSTNAGAYTGLAAGGALGTMLPAYKVNHVLSSDIGKATIDAVKPLGESMMQQLIPDDPNAFKDLIKLTKTSLKASILLLGATAALIGLGIGCAVDTCINHNRAKKADNGLASNPKSVTAKKA